jgi:hypothetical protein
VIVGVSHDLGFPPSMRLIRARRIGQRRVVLAAPAVEPYPRVARCSSPKAVSVQAACD